MNEATWIDLLDPDPATLSAVIPTEVHPSALERLQAAPRHDDEPRPRLETHGNHLFGVMVVPLFVAKDARVVYQEVDLLASRDRLVTVRKTPPDGEPLSFDDVRRSGPRARFGSESPSSAMTSCMCAGC
jgi:hypothetical protein